LRAGRGLQELKTSVSEVIHMKSEEKARPATGRQLAYIKRLQVEIGENQSELKNEISSVEASKMIKGLIDRANGNGKPNRNGKKINEPRLGMAMKESFRVWKQSGWNIYTTHRELFIKDTINTYKLFSEIAERVGQNAG